MPSEISILLAAAATIGLVHTVLGPDHYIPFIVMARAGQWSLKKTMLVTALCGVGHVLSSVVLGAVGIGLGVAISQLEVLEAVRGRYLREKEGWDLYYDVLDALENALEEGDRFVESLREKTQKLVEGWKV